LPGLRFNRGMTHSPGTPRRIAWFLFGSAIAAAAYCQAPLYYSNQNQYMLHGLAEGGVGLLSEDWLANTRDPTPLFTALVAGTVRFLHPWAFYTYYALLIGVYAAALVGVFVALAGDKACGRWAVFAALALAAHAALFRWLSYRWLGFDYPWFLQGGLAGQYVLGAVFQPSAFGVLLVAAVALFATGRPFAAASCVAVAATIHPTYLLPGAMLTLGFMAALYREGRTRTALGVGGLALALVLPVTVFALIRFAPTSADAYAEAQSVLVHFRIPHHSLPGRWFDPIAAVQIAWMLLAAILVRKTPLFLVLAVPIVLTAVLTLAQIAAGSDSLALLFPWRVSAVLMPVSTAVILTRLATVPVPWLDKRPARVAAWSAVGLFAAAGVALMATHQGFQQTGGEERPVLAFVSDAKKPGDVYFVPVSVPDLTKTPRGSLSSDFKPLPDKKVDISVIPVEFMGFRLQTGAPLYVDFKSVPYLDAEVLEWRDRVRFAQDVQGKLKAKQTAEAIAALRDRGVTHLVWPAGFDLRGSGVEMLYEDAYYRVYRIGRPGVAG
jgi:hypothetical protein